MSRSQRLSIALALNFVLVAGQVVFGLVAHSLGLLADAAHNLTDAFALGVALIGVRLSYRLPTPTRSYGGIARRSWPRWPTRCRSSSSPR